jgi:hypothetical protein
MTIDQEMYDAMGNSDDTWASAGSRTGPWPGGEEGGESKHIFLGFTIEKDVFTVGSGNSAKELPGFSVQANYHSITGHGQPTQWRGAISYFPKDMDEVLPTLPARTGRGNQSGVRAEVGRIKNSAGRIIGETPATLREAIDSANALADASNVGVIVAVAVDRKTGDDGVTRTYRREYIQSMFDATGEVPTDD